MRGHSSTDGAESLKPRLKLLERERRESADRLAGVDQPLQQGELGDIRIGVEAVAAFALGRDDPVAPLPHPQQVARQPCQPRH